MAWKTPPNKRFYGKSARGRFSRAMVLGPTSLSLSLGPPCLLWDSSLKASIVVNDLPTEMSDCLITIQSCKFQCFCLRFAVWSTRAFILTYSYFQKYQITLCLSSKVLHKHYFHFFSGTYNCAKRKLKQWLCNILEDKQRVLRYF